MDVQFLTEVLKAFSLMDPGLKGVVTAGTVVYHTAKSGVYVVQKGAQLVSYLIAAKKKKSAPKSTAQKGAGAKKTAKPAQDEMQITKDDVAIVVDISRRALIDVGRFLEAQKIDADIVLVTNDPQYGEQVKFLNPESEEEWGAVVKEFKTMMNKIKRSAGGKRTHIFLAAPAPLVFAMGAVWGTVDTATVYHWEKQTYHRVIGIDRDLR